MIVGADVHKRTHTFVAVTRAASWPRKHWPLLQKAIWKPLGAHQWTERRWALEDCRHLTRRLEPDLLAAST